MITEMPTSVGDLLDAAAGSVGRNLALGEPLSTAAAPDDLSLEHAVVAPLGGAAAGELAVFVDDALVAALQNAAIGELDLVSALAPVFEDLARSLGTVVVGVPRYADGRMAQSRLAGHQHTASVGLFGTTRLRAAVAIGLDMLPSAGSRGAGADTPAPAADRLDLLRGVEMSATAELGRARMTINDLLSLRDGAIIELDRAAGEAADLFVNGRLIARGEVVVVDENYALRITQIVTDEGR